MHYLRMIGLAMVLSASIGSANANAQQLASPTAQQAAYLVRTTIMTIHDANLSNNYSVLRDLASPTLQAKYTASDLRVVFSGVKDKKFDLFAAASTLPQLTQQPLLTADGKLRLTGYFPTRPEIVKFDLVFNAVAGVWRIADVGIAMERSAGAATVPH